MTKTQIAVVAIAAITVAGGIYAHRENAKLVCERFPDLDPKAAKKAYSKMMRKAYTGVYGDIARYDDRDMDNLFLQEYYSL